MEIELCTCEDLSPHEHIPERWVVESPISKRLITLDERTARMNGYDSPVRVIPPTIRIAIDWKEIARDLMTHE